MIQADPLEDRTFPWLLAALSVAFVWILWPFLGAVIWAVVFGVVFAPLDRRFARALRGRRGWAALATLVLVLVVVIIPLLVVGGLLAREAADVYGRMHSGDIDFGRYARDVFDALPAWASRGLDHLGMGDFSALQQRLSQGVLKGGQLFGGIVSAGQNTFEFVASLFVMLYLLFFLLRDGPTLAERLRCALPLREAARAELFATFTSVVRATMKGNVVIALIQGALGGLIFWLLDVRAPLLWAAVMAIVSLVPAIGTALVWAPVAVYFLATGRVLEGVVLTAYGVLVIGLVDNVVRPLLVGKDTKMPDYVILLSTLGGLAALGVNGFVVGPVIAALFIAAWKLFPLARREAG